MLVKFPAVKYLIRNVEATVLNAVTCYHHINIPFIKQQLEKINEISFYSRWNWRSKRHSMIETNLFFNLWYKWKMRPLSHPGLCLHHSWPMLGIWTAYKLYILTTFAKQTGKTCICIDFHTSSHCSSDWIDIASQYFSPL